jgi:hypothetical protein
MRLIVPIQKTWGFLHGGDGELHCLYQAYLIPGYYWCANIDCEINYIRDQLEAENLGLCPRQFPIKKRGPSK